MADKIATLSLPDGKTLDFPVMSGTIGPDVVDIRTLYGKSGMFTYDPGFLSTASCNSNITYIDGDAGVLLYRGYPIEQLAQHCDFLETCYLLLNGELPNVREKDVKALNELLELEDNDLWEIVSGRSERYDARHGGIVARIRAV